MITASSVSKKPRAVQGRYRPHRPHRPYRPTARIHKGLRADGTSAACAQPAHDAPNREPTFAHGPRGQQASTPWPTVAPCRPVGQRGPPLAARRVGTTWPGHRARAAGAVAKIGTVCLRAKKPVSALALSWGAFLAGSTPGGAQSQLGRTWATRSGKETHKEAEMKVELRSIESIRPYEQNPRLSPSKNGSATVTPAPKSSGGKPISGPMPNGAVYANG